MIRIERDYGQLTKGIIRLRFALSDVVMALHVTLHGAPLHPNHHPTCRAAFEKRTTSE